MALTLDNTDTANVEQDADKWEKVVWKVRAGMMPPAGMPRPKPATFESMITCLENELDKHAVTNLPPPGLHRLNRTEYANAIRDLLALDIDPRSICRRTIPPADSTISPARCRSRRAARRLHRGGGKDQPHRHRRREGRRLPSPFACPPTPRRIITSKACRSAPAAD